MHPSFLIEDWAIALCAAAIVTVLFQKIKQPPVLGYLIAGMIVGPYTPPFSFIDDEKDIRILAEFGVIFLMFSLGLEFSLNKLAKVGFSACAAAVIEVFGMLTIGYYTGHFLGWSYQDSLILGAALSISSTTIIIKALENLKYKKEYFAQLMIGILIIEDLLAILLLVFFSNFIQSDTFVPEQVFWAAGKLLLVVTSWLLVGYMVVPYLMRKIKDYINHETLTIISIGLCLFLSAVAIHFQYSVALGAFIMGSILAESPQVHRIEALTLPIRDIFAAVFFVSVGMLIDPDMLIVHFKSIVILSLVTIFGKIMVTSIGALISGQTVYNSTRVGFGMAQIGEFSFIIVGLGSAVEVISESLYPIIVAISAITTFTTPYLIRFSAPIGNMLENHPPKQFTKFTTRYQNWLNSLTAHVEKGTGERIVRFVVNGLVVAIILRFTASYLLPQFGAVADLFTLFGSLFIASPFLWAMMRFPKFSYFASALALLEVGALTLMADPSLAILLGVLIGVILWILVAEQSLKQLYCSLESFFFNNLSKPTDDVEEKFLIGQSEGDNIELYMLKTLQIEEGSSAINRTIAMSDLIPRAEGMIVGLERQGRKIMNPEPNTILKEGDTLLIFGKNS